MQKSNGSASERKQIQQNNIRKLADYRNERYGLKRKFIEIPNKGHMTSNLMKPAKIGPQSFREKYEKIRTSSFSNQLKNNLN